mgnify:CR=1 FL=1
MSVVKEYSKEVKDRNIFIGLMLVGLFYTRAIIIDFSIYLAILMGIAIVISVLVYLNNMKDINLKDLFKWKNIKTILILVIIMRVVALGFTFIGVKMYGDVSLNDQAIIDYINGLTSIEMIEFFIYKNFWGPIREEFVYRYVMIGNIGKMSKLSVIISSALFSSIHAAGNLWYWIMYFLMGLILAITYYKTERIDICIAVHMLNNIL